MNLIALLLAIVFALSFAVTVVQIHDIIYSDMPFEAATERFRQAEIANDLDGMLEADAAAFAAMRASWFGRLILARKER